MGVVVGLFIGLIVGYVLFAQESQPNESSSLLSSLHSSTPLLCAFGLPLYALRVALLDSDGRTLAVLKPTGASGTRERFSLHLPDAYFDKEVTVVGFEIRDHVGATILRNKFATTPICVPVGVPQKTRIEVLQSAQSNWPIG